MRARAALLGLLGLGRPTQGEEGRAVVYDVGAGSLLGFVGSTARTTHPDVVYGWRAERKEWWYLSGGYFS